MSIESLAELMDAADQAGTGETILPIESIRPDPNQPRKTFDPDTLRQLADSIVAQGIVQSIVVRTDPEGQADYILVAGERRWRAAQMAGLQEIPAIVRDLSDDNALAIQLIENANRDDVSPLEEAIAIERLVKVLGNASKAAKALGRSATYVSRRRKLLKLPEEVIEFAKTKDIKDAELIGLLGDLWEISEGAARAFINHPEKLNRLALRNAVTTRTGSQDDGVKEKDNIDSGDGIDSGASEPESQKPVAESQPIPDIPAEQDEFVTVEQAYTLLVSVEGEANEYTLDLDLLKSKGVIVLVDNEGVAKAVDFRKQKIVIKGTYVG